VVRIDGDFGPDYSIQTSTNLYDWTTVFTTNQPAVPFNWIDTNPVQPAVLFYRILLTP
jgi:hypothetical protein